MSSVFLEVGQVASDPLPIETESVLFPVLVKLFARYAGMTIERDLNVLPPAIPRLGTEANTRVQEILDTFVVGGKTLASYERALTDVRDVRNISFATSQDIYLAAAEHYLVALTNCLAGTSLITPKVVPPFELLIVPAYELIKVEREGANFPPSPRTPLSLLWGWRGVADAAQMLYNPSVDQGGFPVLPLKIVPTQIATPVPMPTATPTPLPSQCSAQGPDPCGSASIVCNPGAVSCQCLQGSVELINPNLPPTSDNVVCTQQPSCSCQ